MFILKIKESTMKTRIDKNITDCDTDNLLQHPQPRVNMLLPPPILLLVLAALSACIHLLRWGGFQFSPVRVIIGGNIVLLGCLLIYLCGKSFLKEKTPIRPDRIHTMVIIKHGPYAFSRNPMYLGMVLVLLGLSIFLKSPIFLFSTLIFIITLHFGVVKREERYLLQMYPDIYAAYMKNVRRWL